MQAIKNRPPAVDWLLEREKDSALAADAWEARLSSVLTVIYLIFNEGYSASAGEAPIRYILCDEATRLGRALGSLCPSEPEERPTG